MVTRCILLWKQHCCKIAHSSLCKGRYTWHRWPHKSIIGAYAIVTQGISIQYNIKSMFSFSFKWPSMSLPPNQKERKRHEKLFLVLSVLDKNLNRLYLEVGMCSQNLGCIAT